MFIESTLPLVALPMPAAPLSPCASIMPPEILMSDTLAKLLPPMPAPSVPAAEIMPPFMYMPPVWAPLIPEAPMPAPCPLLHLASSMPQFMSH